VGVFRGQCGVVDTTWNVKLFFRLSWTEVLQGHKDL